MRFDSFHPDDLSHQADWAGRLRHFAMRWASPPAFCENELEDEAASALTYEYSPFGSAPFLGGGNLGAMLWQDETGLRFEINACDAYDKRPGAKTLYGRNRVRNGYFHLPFSGEASTQWDVQLSLWDAALSGSVVTSKGSFALHCYVHAVHPVMVTSIRPEGGEAFAWDFVSLPIDSTRAILWAQKDQYISDYPPAQSFVQEGIHFCMRPLCEAPQTGAATEAAGASVNAWCVRKKPDGSAVVYSTFCFLPRQKAPDEALDKAKKQLLDAMCFPEDALFALHTGWWHAQYRRSAVLLPDSTLESFYWVQLYKVLSAAREDGPVLDLFAPWFKPSGWSAVWTNLNVQMAYSPWPAAGHGALCRALGNWLDFGQLQACAKHPALPTAPGSMALPCVALASSIEDPLQPPEGLLETRTTIGNLPYCLLYLWEYYACTMDDSFLKSTLLPLLCGALRYYDAYLYEDAQQVLHLPYTWSPEWGVNTKDSNFELALLRWCCKKLAWAAARLHLQGDVFSRAEFIAQHLTGFVKDDKHGLYIGENEPYHHSHRHWSHLFAIYPCGLLRYDDAKNKALIENSLRQFMSYQELYTGFSWVGIASLYALCGNGNEALKHLYKLLRAKDLWPNTMYTEMGERAWPTIETPLAVNQTLHEMLLRSEPHLCVFPALPAAWKNCGFYRLIAHGGFAVSAALKEGAVEWICIESLAGEPCTLQAPDSFRPACVEVVAASGSVALQWEGALIHLQHFQKNDWAVLAVKHLPRIEFPGIFPSYASWGEHKPL